MTIDPSLAQSPTADLEQALRSKVDVNGPFGYVTLTPLCAACDPSTELVELYLVPSAEDPEVRTVAQAWVDDVETDPAGAVWSIDPVDVPRILLEAMDAGKSVAWTIHAGTFLVDSWTIDGVGASYSCYQVDTGSIELRTRTCSGGMLGRG